MIRKPVIVLAALAAVISGAAAGSGKSRIESTSAYFSDRESHTNIYTFGEVSADGTETEWNPEHGTHLLPGESMPKNPQIVNTGANAAVVFIALDSPVLSRVRTAQPDGSYQEASSIEAWHYLQNDGTEGFHENWILLETDTPKANVIRRIFGYCGALPGKNEGKTAETVPLFTSIQAVNYVEGSMPMPLPGIDVRFLAVQAENLALDDGTVTTLESTRMMSEATLRKIWSIASANADFTAFPDADKANRLDLHAKELGGKENAG